jgi:adenylate cyclase
MYPCNYGQVTFDKRPGSNAGGRLARGETYHRGEMTEGGPIGYVVLDPGCPGEGSFELVDRIFVGRECAGVDDSRRILLSDDLSVSRNHLEIRVDQGTSRAMVFDTSSNGTRVNGIRIERSVGVPLTSGDLVQIGDHVLEFRSGAGLTRGTEHAAAGTMYATDRPTMMAIAVGDLINFSTVSEQADGQVLARDIDRLYGALRELLGQHRGTVANYMGDAFFAVWELDADAQAVDHSLTFALAASHLTAEVAPTLALRYADGTPLRMGWALTSGPAVVHMMPGSLVMVLGDAVNVGFRLSGIAGRDGRPTVLASQAVLDKAVGPYGFGPPETVAVKGRVEPETIYGVTAP